MSAVQILIFVGGLLVGCLLTTIAWYRRETIGILHIDISEEPANLYLELDDDPDKALDGKQYVTLKVIRARE